MSVRAASTRHVRAGREEVELGQFGNAMVSARSEVLCVLEEVMCKARLHLVSVVLFLLSGSLQAQTGSPRALSQPGMSGVVTLGTNPRPLRVSPPRSLPLHPLAVPSSSNTGSGPFQCPRWGLTGCHCHEYVDTYYAGGTGSDGTGPGPNFGVTFSSNAEVLADRHNRLHLQWVYF